MEMAVRKTHTIHTLPTLMLASVLCLSCSPLQCAQAAMLPVDTVATQQPPHPVSFQP